MKASSILTCVYIKTMAKFNSMTLINQANQQTWQKEIFTKY